MDETKSPEKVVVEETVSVKELPKKNTKTTVVILAVSIVVILAGVGSGWLLSRKGAGPAKESDLVPSAKTTAKEAGLADEETFKDTAEGVLEEGGINGEGTHHLVRPGGSSQNAYLTSTVIDLNAFVGKKVQVWGQTISARKAGWLMDVGKIKVIE